MDRGHIIRDTILLALAERYESDRSQFVTLQGKPWTHLWHVKRLQN